MADLVNQSRYQLAEQITDPAGRLLTEEREPFRFQRRDDNIFVQIGEGVTLQDLAEALYWPITERACGLWWVLADYQDPPIVDPTLRLRPGAVVVAPSSVVVVTEILLQRREVFIQ
jgi:hypothetical protein